MIIGIGLDVVEIDRIRAVYLRHPARFAARVLTPRERSYVFQYRDPFERIAGRWAAKEAAFKALGTGIGDGVSWRDAEILPGPRGAPALHLHGAARRRAGELGATVAHVTITHTAGLAVAQVILERP